MQMDHKFGKIILLDSLNFLKDRDIIRVNKKESIASSTKITKDHEVSFDEEKLFSLAIPTLLEERLFEHQTLGVRWLYYVYLKKSGGILGDDMGLGIIIKQTNIF